MGRKPLEVTFLELYHIILVTQLVNVKDNISILQVTQYGTRLRSRTRAVKKASGGLGATWRGDLPARGRLYRFHQEEAGRSPGCVRGPLRTEDSWSGSPACTHGWSPPWTKTCVCYAQNTTKLVKALSRHSHGTRPEGRPWLPPRARLPKVVRRF